jgi:hypothetical protein
MENMETAKPLRAIRVELKKNSLSRTELSGQDELCRRAAMSQLDSYAGDH